MSKINTNKMNDFESVRGLRTGDVKSAGKSEMTVFGSRAGVGADKLQFSGTAAEAGRFLDQLRELPDVRDEKVTSLRNQIASGVYQPSNEDIAAAILRDEN